MSANIAGRSIRQLQNEVEQLLVHLNWEQRRTEMAMVDRRRAVKAAIRLRQELRHQNQILRQSEALEQCPEDAPTQATLRPLL